MKVEVLQQFDALPSESFWLP